ncbi:PBP1A family penicillin-binding protein [Paenibacillus sp. LHD-117]|uniref:transglycosylase domain-containing protein n=1 Tax=Paenibacillus sp. LHD-117 TaxID=3071412 RepID=UPI0027E003AB|nr:PBP1A family penicillin-binding protein [Paenibacillus sp. LHD-117]MDQ6418110.1 PBP1A family penicillin-binding protein [Paenibacillus sp. LHD-117]
MAEQSKIRKSGSKGKKRKRLSGRAWFYGIFFTVVIGIVCGIIGYLLIILNGERLLEEHGSKLEFGEASIIYDAKGEEISRLYDVMDHREVAEFAEIPEFMRDAIVATEDQRFYEHAGLDFWAIGRAVVKDVIARSAVEGGSTITQQLAKNVFLSADKTFFRKATEASIAVALEQQMTKDEILAMYLNRIYFGKGVHGVKAAADYYFGVELKDLELWQAATLAAMPKAPNRYNPINNPEDSMDRRAVVLQLMYDQKYITQEQMEEAKAVVYEAPAHQEQFKSGSYPAFVDFVIEEAMEVTKLSEEELRVSGLHIYTTLNQQAQQSMDTQFDNADNFEKSKDEQIVQGSMIIIDHRSGEIQALAGGRDYVKKGWNRVTKLRQPGSAIKPIVSYGPALESGDYFPWTELANDKKCFSNYCPTDRWGATPVSMKQAIKDSRNLAAVWMLNQVGIKQGAAFAEKLGIQLEDDDMNLALALGGLTKGASPLQMATAYSVMANGGKSVDPHTITRIEGNQGFNYTYEAPASKQLMSPETAWYLTDMMLSVVEKGGTGSKAAIDRPVAGKTGTTQHGIKGYSGDGIKDAWFVGYTAEWTAAVWMGYDKTDMDHFLKKGGTQSAALFAKIMKPAMQGVGKDSFKRPGGAKENKPPAKVNNFTAVYNPEEVRVDLSWDASPEPDVTYEIFRKELNESEYTRFDSRTTTGVTDMSIFPGMTYDYYVVAYDAKNELASEPSETVRIEVPEVELPDIPMEPDPTDPVDPGDGTTEPGDGNDGGNDGNNGTDEPTAPVETEPGDGGEPTPTPTGTNQGGEAAIEPTTEGT